jgi:tRNA(Ile)-lysidine synthase
VRFDISNLDQTYFRNWLRHTVLPLLSEHNPGVRDVLCRMAEVASADYELVHAEMERVWPQVARVSTSAIVFDRTVWKTLPLSLKRATIREAIHRLRRGLRNINFVHVERAVNAAEHGGVGDRATLAEGLLLTLTYDSFMIADEEYQARLPNWPLLEPGTRVAVNVPGRSHLPGTDWALESELLAVKTGYHDNPDPWTAYLDAEVCSGPLMLRTRLPGDRIAPQGMGGHHMKLNQMMINARVPQRARDRMPILACCEAAPCIRILWACGLRIDEQAGVTSATRRILRLRFVMTD